MQIQFQSLKAGILQGAIRYTFYPGTRLLQQEAVMVTHEPDTAILYDTGLCTMNAPGQITYYDNKGQLQTELPPARSGTLSQCDTALWRVR